MSKFSISHIANKININNLPFFRKKTIRKVGLDIGTYNIKVAEIEIKDGLFEIVNIGAKDIRETKDIPTAIKALFEEIHISSKEVNISVSGENVAARYLSLPQMTEDELRKAMAFELENHIPFKPEEIYTDYCILEDEPESKNRLNVFLVATKKDLLDARVNLVTEAGLEPRITTMDALALKNTFYFNYPSKNQANIVLLNIGDRITNLIIAQGKTPYFVRDTRFGGDAITSLIQTKLELTKNDAENLKHSLGKSRDDVSQIIKSSLANLLSEIFLSIDFYENLTERRIDEVYISGGSCQLNGLYEFLSEYLNLNIYTLESFKNFSISPNIPQETLKKLLPYSAVAIGLALEEY